MASASPRRQELLKYIFDEFDIIPADVDESISEDIAVDIRPEKIAERKALHIAEKHPESMVIGCDTAVIVDDIMLGKPKDEHDARKMLRMLSGRTHKVITGNSFVCDNRIKAFRSLPRWSFILSPRTKSTIIFPPTTGVTRLEPMESRARQDFL